MGRAGLNVISLRIRFILGILVFQPINGCLQLSWVYNPLSDLYSRIGRNTHYRVLDPSPGDYSHFGFVTHHRVPMAVLGLQPING